jgi:hypothetical protein
MSFIIPIKGIQYKVLSVISKKYISGNKTTDLSEILDDVLKKTNQDLSFNLKSPSNKVFVNKEANCVGYSVYYNFLLSKKLKEKNIGNVTISHVRSKIILLGQNIHFYNSPSFKDHDISIVKNNTNGEVYYIDPSLSEVFGNIIIKQ